MPLINDRFTCLNVHNYHIGFAIICLIGCLYHISSLCKVYFVYPTTVTVTIERHYEVELPAISFCSSNEIIVRRDKVKETDPWKKEIATMKIHNVTSRNA